MTGLARTFLTATVLGALALAAAQEPKRTTEKWADPKLLVTAGLELWLDASRANGEKLVPHDGKLDVWFDASGRGRHLRQSTVAARPTRLPAGGSALVRFDGVDDHLRAIKQATELESFTLFVVATPRLNLGGFRAALAFNAAGKRDFETGLTLDLGPFGTPRFSVLNVEGRGFGTFQNLMKGDHPFGGLHTLEVTADAKAVRLAVDGAPAGERPRDGKPVSLDEITLGARYYSLGGSQQQVQGFGQWDVAEVLVYSRALPADEARRVRAYLDAKHAALRQQLPPDPEGPAAPLVPVKDPPPVQMLLPGFTVRELPVDLTNVNNVLYRPDGTLVALGYNGIIWHLRDTDGDGLEDKADVFWDSRGGLRSPIGMDLTPRGYKHGDGVFVVAKTRCVLIVDTDKDGKADREIVVAEGWKESFHQVDGLGVAFDKRTGDVYFGRGTYNFADPLLKDKEGKPQYKLTDEAGSIIRVSPDFKSREIVATGIRFPVGLRFNRHGDLFATDQEGATWVPNGNPLDELLHIQKGRHYGFPSRHPKHVPDVIDEPSTFDYGPQHQSTCGFAFNEPVRAGAEPFGPAAWAGDAIVTGESRGKLYRTQLVKSAAGYVARTQLLACLSQLTIDCCVAPDRSLVVACHSGGPDWGSGPTGKGKLYKITYTDRDHPQPVLAWPNGPREVRVEFDRPVDPQLLRDVLRQTKLTAGRHARAGDRFESIWPGYAIVQVQKAAPRLDVPVRSAQLTPDRRTLVLATDPHPAAVHYALTLPGMGRPAADRPPPGALRQVPEIDLDFDLTGCEAAWTPAGGGPAWVGWLPHPELEVARAMTRDSAPHDALWEAMEKPGELVLRMKLDLVDMLRPAIQPGSQIDYELPPEEVTVTFESSAALKLLAPAGKSDGRTVSFTVRPKPNALTPVELRLTSPGGRAPLALSFTTSEDRRPRPIPLRRLLLPWADTDTRALGREVTAIRAPELEGGSWERGRAEFFGEQAGCAKCHAVHGQGGDLGPDLSNLIHRDYASVLRDITEPSFAINPDHLTYVVHLADGRSLTGVVRTAGNRVRIGDVKGVITEVNRADVERMSPASISTMPDGLPKLLGPERLRDLMTFLLTAPPRAPGAADSPAWAEIRVVDAATGRGVPLVELETVNALRFVTDNAGRVAFHEPGLMDEEVYFSVRSHGYEVKKDGFGFPGVRITPRAGKIAEIKLTRTNIAERLCRLTGEGRYRDTLLLGHKPPLPDSPNPGRVAGQDSIQAAIHRDKVYWFWGDTQQMRYPLGLFRMAGATTPIPDAKADLAAGLPYNYFVDPKTRFARAMMPIPERPEGVVWVGAVFVVPDEKGVDRLVGHYSRRKGLVGEFEQGIAVFNDEKQIFEPAKELPLKETWRRPAGHPILHEEGGKKWLLFGSPTPNVRVPATLKDVLNPERYEAFTCASAAAAGKSAGPALDANGKPAWRWQKDLPPTDSKTEQTWIKAGKLRPEHARFCPADAAAPAERVVLHSGTVRWNAHRKRWVLVAGQIGGKSLLGEVWYSESKDPTGPFAKAVRVVTHDRMTFYNVCHHAFLDQAGGRHIHFEGTYTNDFSGNPDKTPRYNYNQVLYRLDLDSASLRPAFCD